jgi:hypothetical protein
MIEQIERKTKSVNLVTTRSCNGDGERVALREMKMVQLEGETQGEKKETQVRKPVLLNSGS